MPTYGITPQGFVPKPQDAILSGMEASAQTTFGAAINLEAESNFAQFFGIFAEQLAELWEAAEGVYLGQYPDSATGTSLDNVSGITGTVRSPATSSNVTELLVGTNGTVVPAGTIVQVQDSGGNFVTQADATAMTAVQGWPQDTAVTQYELFSQDGNLYVCTQAGTTENVTHGAGYWTDLTGTAITDGSAVWRFLCQGAYTSSAACLSQNTGPVVAPAYTLTAIQTPVFGLANAVNLQDAVPGVNQASDGSLRVTRETELRGEGNSAADAIRAKVLELAGVISCTVFENDTDATDGNGLPPHSVNVLVQGGAAQDIWNTIWASKAGGIATYGAQSGTVVDSEGQSHTINYDIPTLVDVYVVVDVTTNADYPDDPQFPDDGVTQIQAALTDWATGDLLDDSGVPMFGGYGVGDPVVTSKLYVPVETVAGIFDVTHIYIGTAPAPGSSANIIPTARQLLVFDSTRITVNVTVP